MKRSSNVSLLVMGTLAFTASFAGGSAFLAMTQPKAAQTCTKGPDGVESCTPSRGGYGRYFGSYYWSYPFSRTPAASALTGSPQSLASGTSEARGTSRGGFGASGRAASAHGSAGG